MPRTLFGTDGVRGRANSEPMTAEIAMRIGMAAGQVFRRGAHRNRAVIGKDTRLSGYMIEQALTAGFLSVGVDVLLLGPVPTPAVGFLTRSMRADVGVMISASHNPYEDNGIKLFGPDGFKLSDAVESQIGALVASPQEMKLAASPDIGRARRIDDSDGRYIEAVKGSVAKALDLSGLKIVVDCANGAAYKVAPTVLWELGAEVVSIGVQPDGTNINAHAGALYPQGMCQAVRDLGADMGIALDGDADRVIVADEKGNIVDGDAIMALCARRMIRRGELRQNTLVATVMSNLGLERAVQDMGGQLLRTAVGDRYVVEAMRQGGYNLGGEQSGHLVFLDHMTTGDGCIGALQVLTVMQDEGKPLSELAQVMKPYPQVLVNVKVKQKQPIHLLGSVQRLIQSVEAKLGQEGRVLVRYSGTEPKARVMLEGPDETLIHGFANEIAAELVRACGG